MNFEQIEDCMPDGAVSLTDGLTGVTAQWLHEFAHEVAAKEREACAKLCETAEVPIDIDVWMGTKKALTAATAIGLATAIRKRSNASICGYSQPDPVTPADEVQALQQQFILATKELKAMSQRLEAITARANLSAVR